MPEFFRNAGERLAYLGPEPDRWRNKAEASLKWSQEPDHFIDMERTAGIGELPNSRYDYIQKLYAYRTGLKKDADLYLPAILEGFLGSKKWMASRLGQAGGKSRSLAKKSASRANGRLGGRPRRKTRAV